MSVMANNNEASTEPKAFPTGSVPATTSAENFFEKMMTDSTWVGNWTADISPANSLDEDRLVFNLPPVQGDNFLFLQNMRLRLSIMAKNKNGDKIPDDLLTAPIASFAQSMFNSVRLYLNDTQVSGGTGVYYPFYTYINNMLNYSDDKKRGELSLGGHFEEYWENEGFVKMDLDNPFGWTGRRTCLSDLQIGEPPEKKTVPGTPTEAGRPFSFLTKPRTFEADVLTEFHGCTLPMLSNVGGRLEVTKAPPEFYMCCPWDSRDEVKQNSPRIILKAATLLIPMKKMHPKLSVRIEQHLMKEPQIYRTTRVDMKKVPFPKGSLSFNSDNLKQTATCPDRMAIFIVPEDRMDFAYGESALRFSAYIESPKGKKDPDALSSLVSCKLTLNDVSLENGNDRLTNTHELATRKLAMLNQVMGFSRSDTGPNIDYPNFYHGKFVIMYDLTQSGDAAVYNNKMVSKARDGWLRLEMRFDKPTPQNAYIFIMSEFRSRVTVDKNRNVVYNYLDY